jgi:hypothetical protein
MEPTPCPPDWPGSYLHGSHRAFFPRDDGQRIFGANCKHRLADGQVELRWLWILTAGEAGGDGDSACAFSDAVLRTRTRSR